MTAQDKVQKKSVTAQELQDALDTVKNFLADASPQQRAEAGLYPDLSREYDPNFSVDAAYKAELPDLQNGPSSLIKGENRSIQHVGISNFRLPIHYRTRGGSSMPLETSVTGSVSLDANKKGINMSRIMRSFYKHSETTFSLDVIRAALDDYKRDLESLDARIMMRLSYPMQVPSLRSGLMGYQYYDIALEQVDQGDHTLRAIHLDYVYSSTCPCSLELSEHARAVRGQMATPHSQRSVARISVEVKEGARLWFEDLIELCRAAVPTETQVMVKREDEQAFAELNAANPIFVEDAARLFAQQLSQCDTIGDYRVIASHQESLHSHDAISMLTQGPTFAQNSYDPQVLSSLIHRG
ncbi:MAG: GTP cyclohydrolase FolE2 [Paracoccaceae bacterium]